MIVLADSSPLIVLSKLSCLDFLQRLFRHVYVSAEVRHEVVAAGAGRPAASEVSSAAWIEARSLRDSSLLPSAQKRYSLGAGEMSTILLAKELKADLVIFDDLRARRIARQEGFEIMGTVGLLERFYLLGYLTDLRETFRHLLASEVYIDRRLLDSRLQSLGLPSLLEG